MSEVQKKVFKHAAKLMHLACGVPRLAALQNNQQEILKGLNW